MRFDILTIFPELFEPFLKTALLGKAIEKGLLEVAVHNLRDFAADKHKTVDDVPYGGGAGMVFRCEPVVAALEAVTAGRERCRRLYLSPRGSLLTQKKLEELRGYTSLCLLCGRYEGIDQRIVDHWIDEEISIGEYVVSGGELPAMILIEGVSRLVEGVVGDAASVAEDSISRGGIKYPQYTRPADFRGHLVPEVLRSGHAARIRQWREEQARLLTVKKTGSGKRGPG